MNAMADRRVFLVDDHPVIRLGLTQVIGSEVGIEVAGQAGGAEEALAEIGEDVDLVITDLRMEGLDGLALTRLLKQKRPELPVLLLSSYEESLYAEQAIEAGASGYLMKEIAADQLANAIRAALAGKLFLSATMWDRLLPAPVRELPELTDPQRQVLDSLTGVPVGDRIRAEALGISVSEFGRRRMKLMRACRVTSPIQLVLLAHWLATHPS